MSSLAIAVIVVVLAALGTPIFALLGALGLYLFHADGTNTAVVIIELFRLASLPALIAIPLFTFAGFILAESKAPQRMLAMAEALIGWLPGGLAIVALLSAALFTAFTGASGVTIIALGGILYPMLKNQKYPESFSLGLITTTGSLGLMFPPSLPIILYGLVAGVSIDKLFTAGAVPGIMLIVLLSIYSAWIGWRSGLKSIPFSQKALLKACRESVWEIPLPFLIIGGIYGGVFTATDAAAVMAFYVIVVEVFIYKDIRIAELPQIVYDSMALVGSILIVLGCALGMTNYMIDADVPDRIFAVLHQYVDSKVVFLIVLNFLLLIINMIEIFSAIIIVVPIIVPIAVGQYGIDPVHLGIIFLLNLEIGYMTPPLGLNLFLSNKRFDVPLFKLYKATFVFWAIHVFMLGLVTYIPSLSLSLLKK